MYKLISKNIISTDNGIGYVYSLPQINLLYTSDKSFNDTVTAIIKKIKMRGEIIITSSKVDVKTLEDKFENVRSSFKVDNEDLRERLISETLANFGNTSKFMLNPFIILTEINTPKPRNKLFKFGSEKVTLSKRQIEFAKIINETILNEIHNIDKNVKEVDEETCNNLMNYLEFNNEKDIECCTIDESSERLDFTYEDTNGNIDKSCTKYIQVSDMPVIKELPFDFMNKFSIQNFPIDIFIKFDIDINNAKLEKKMFHAKNNIIKDKKKYERDNGRTLQEYKEKIALAEQGVKEFQELNKFLFHFQIYFRIRARNKELLEKRYQHLKRLLKPDKINIISSLGKQYELHQHLKILSFSNFEYINKVDSNYFSKLRLQTGNLIGTPKYKFALPKFYTNPDKMPVFFDEFLPLTPESTVKATTSVTAYVGVSGSGKTQLSNNNKFIDVIAKGVKCLTIDPKGDRRGFKEKVIDGDKFINEIDLADTEKYRGSFDPFILWCSNISELKLKVSSLMLFFLKLGEKKDLYDNVTISESIESYINDNEGCNVSLIGFLRYLSERKEAALMADTILSFSTLKYCSLFFSNGEENNIDYSKLYTIIILDEISSESDTMESKIVRYVLENTDTLIMNYMKSTNGLFEIEIDEYEYFVKVTGLYIGSKVSKLVRSHGGVFSYATQNFSMIPEDLLSQTTCFFIGRFESESELKLVCDYFKLNIKEFEFLLTKSSEEEESEDMKNAFLFVDQNNRKAKVKFDMLPMFSKAFDTKTKVGVQ